jgi:hypothetical protein
MMQERQKISMKKHFSYSKINLLSIAEAGCLQTNFVSGCADCCGFVKGERDE